jgi:hypothetical protein
LLAYPKAQNGYAILCFGINVVLKKDLETKSLHFLYWTLD